MDYIAVVSLEVLNAIAALLLASVGLAIVFGMMKVINLAHGEFIMMGGYAAITASGLGINIWIATLVVAPLVVGLIGLVVERIVMRHLYGRMVDTMLATWGLSLLFIGLVTSIYGNTTIGLSSPLGSMTVGAYQVSLYTLFILAVAAAVMIGLFLLLTRTSFGLVARGVMQNPGMAAALGVNPAHVYSATFSLGAALAGLAGGVLAPITGVVPTIGVAYVAKSFITVIGGGASIITGTLAASGLFGAVNQLTTFATTPVIGEVGLLLVAIVLVRLLPQGITGRFFRGRI
ncbi:MULTISPECIES: branched-chain amino acid ABC transporter permease [unclassified Herbaspirillum]|uniref:branched-chain amino acid ABC transporter permease n=1 Tax=unclassified Herbaspirillum TaxID=2624150 RepID=UPI001153FBC6|nr:MULTISPECIES: branched-chain amino acid ABC transporter permease [unclassified Herbaspirillum]MBB5391317.1 branched-chain amino acid transport system permease protein [Herbaspirillum sp. SJZ102]TQK12996.1 amino acid/amide ABC transporter membrane protein 1 (HAAT family) [Herbaspirillum sp. SJZ130]TQK15000.1 amino acid/amide ABC transporter membrane protein 1 (HAAT family) [Herbaspirillum sp. SJZ106]